MGAPPSRTNPEGQAWGYPVLDPDLYHAGGARAERAGPALRFFADRIERLLDDFDGLRIDHPHGLVCPWVYEAGAPRPLEAVRAGARLFSSPDLQDHPRLARFAIARPRDLAPRAEGRPRYADDWVRRLDEAQVARYAVLMDALMRLVRARGRGRSDVCTEVLSTCPYPLARVLERHGLGRVRVVQKADPSDEHDPYRSARAAPEDWITLGTHDTPPIWRVLRGRMGGPAAAAWASYLARRLAPRPNAREALGTRLVSDGRALVEALFADLFVGPARHVSVFFADFLGLRDTYNVPGTVSDLNWSLRVPPDFESVYARRRARGEALDVARALALALRARAAGASGDLHDLAAALEVRRAREA
jgi:4-alpha-glucanotransferase